MTLIYIRNSNSTKDKNFLKNSLSGSGEIYDIEEGDLSIAPVPAENEAMIFTFLRDMTPEMEGYLFSHILTGLSATN